MVTWLYHVGTIHWPPTSPREGEFLAATDLVVGFWTFWSDLNVWSHSHHQWKQLPLGCKRDTTGEDVAFFLRNHISLLGLPTVGSWAGHITARASVSPGSG